MPVRIVPIIDTTLNDTQTSIAATHDFQGVTPKRVTFYVVMDETASANDATVTLTVELSPDDGATLVSYDKLLTQDGTDAPQASEVYTTDEDDVLSISPEDVVDYLKITLTGTNVDASDFYAVKVWMVYTY